MIDGTRIASDALHCRPQKIAPGNPLVGEFAAGDAPAESPLSTISRLSDDLGASDLTRLVGGGALVVVLSDGAYGGYLDLVRQPVGTESTWSYLPYCLDEDDSLDPLDALLSDQDRHSASDAASATMREARRTPRQRLGGGCMYARTVTTIYSVAHPFANVADKNSLAEQRSSMAVQIKDAWKLGVVRDQEGTAQ